MDIAARGSTPLPMPDALLIVSFGGPEGPDDVMPFLERVVRGRDVPRARLEEVAHHYHALGGVSPINQANRDLIAALEPLIDLPIYWGNRNWTPLLEDEVHRMHADGVRHALAFVTSAFGSYSGCRQYLEDIERARETIGPDAPIIDRLPLYGLRAGFLDAQAAQIRAALERARSTASPATANPFFLFTAHSIPSSMAARSPYVDQLRAACAQVMERLGGGEWELVWQSRSGPPQIPWLEPDIGDALRARATERTVVVVPIGFTSDHVEVIWDLDNEAAEIARELGIEMIRASTVGTHPLFVQTIVQLVEEGKQGRVAQCASDCCPPPSRGRSPNVATR